jgi:hypothetical protein
LPSFFSSDQAKLTQASPWQRLKRHFLVHRPLTLSHSPLFVPSCSSIHQSLHPVPFLIPESRAGMRACGLAGTGPPVRTRIKPANLRSEEAITGSARNIYSPPCIKVSVLQRQGTTVLNGPVTILCAHTTAVIGFSDHNARTHIWTYAVDKVLLHDVVVRVSNKCQYAKTRTPRPWIRPWQST